MDDALFKIRSKSPAFVLNPIKAMLKLAVDIISLQQLEYEMYCSDPPNYYNCFEIVYCGHPDFPYANIQLEQATKLILSHFWEEEHPLFLIPSTTKIHNWFASIWFTDLRNTHLE